jgi:hypothetical protein
VELKIFNPKNWSNDGQPLLNNVLLKISLIKIVDYE